MSFIENQSISVPRVRAYWDATAGVRPTSSGIAALNAALEDGWADTRRVHTEARRARSLLDAARHSTATSLNCRADEVTFADSHPVALSTAVAGGVRAAVGRTPRPLVYSAIEHRSVLLAAEQHQRDGAVVAQIRVDEQGLVTQDALKTAIHGLEQPAVCIQLSNTEVGTIQDLPTLAPIVRDAGGLLIVDAGRSLADIDLPQDWDVLACGAVGWGAPLMQGVLLVRHGSDWRPPFPVDSHESGRHHGPVSIPAVFAAAVTLREALAERDPEYIRRFALIERMRQQLPQLVPHLVIVGHPQQRLPHILTFSCLYVDGEALVLELDRLGFAVGSGSVCVADGQQPSHVLTAMGVLTQGNVRISLPTGTPPGVLEEQVERFLQVVPTAVANIREYTGVDI